MEFLKNHYEKLILGVIVLGLVISAVMVSMKTSDEEISFSAYERKASPIDLSTNEAAMARFDTEHELNLEDKHYLFNPGVWQRKPDGSFITGSQLGPKGLTIKDIRPLKFMVVFADTTTGSTPRCSMRIQRVTPPGERGLPEAVSSTLMAVGDENDFFTLTEMRPPEAPQEVILQMKNSEEVVTLEKGGEPYQRIEGYIADLRYDAENKNFDRVREKSSLVLSGETNNIVSVTSDEIVLINPVTTLRTTLKYNAAP